jgi:hypothetical protein
MEAQSEALNRILLGFPGIEQSNPVEDAAFIRFTIRLHADPLDNHQQPEIYILFTRSEFEQISTTQERLEEAFNRNIRQHSFKDAINGKTVETSVQRDSSGVWRARTVDGVKWMFDKNRDLWIKAPVAFRA